MAPPDHWLRPLAVLGVLARRGLPGLGRAAAARSWRPAAAALCEALESLGPAFIKLGQFLSVRPDLLPPEALEELERLQDRAAPVPLARIEQTLAKELGAPAERLFREFQAAPLAAASLSQVHRAVLPDGSPVAVKVRRPGAERALRRDLQLAGSLLRRLHALSPLRRRTDFRALWAEVVASAEAELDFRREAEVAVEMARNFRAFPGVTVPRVHWGWTGRRVLTTDLVAGLKISDAANRRRPEYPALAECGARAFLKQVLEDGLFHADLHPANLLITPAGEIAYLDFGIVGRLSPGERHAVAGTLVGLLARDPPTALRHLGRLGVRVPQEHAAAFARDVAQVMEDALAPTLAALSVARIGRGIPAAVHRNRVAFPRRHALLIKALLTIEGTARLLHPSFSFESAARSWVVDFTRRNLGVSDLLRGGWRAAALLGLGWVEGWGAPGGGQGPRTDGREAGER